MGTFDGIQIGSTGIAAQRRGIETAGQNISNVNTPGYTRQRVNITPDSGPVTPALHSTWDGTGLGVRSTVVERLRNIFIDRRMRDELADQSEQQTVADTYRSLEGIFDEPSDTGFSSVLADFLAAWDDVANNPGDVGARAQLVERAQTLASDLRQAGTALDDAVEVMGLRLETLVEEANTDAAQVANLNRAILSAKASGLNTNELEDQRDLLLEGLAQKVGGTVRLEDDGTATMFVGGTALVRGTTAVQMRYEESGGTSEILWDLDGRTVDAGGEAKGLLRSVNEIIPAFRADLDGVAQGLHDSVNAIHATGFDRNGDPGEDFFVMGVDGIELNPNIAADPAKVAAANAAGTLDGSVAAQIADLTGTDSSYREMIVRLGVNSQSAARRVQLQDQVVEQVRGEQESASGVNLDEELSDLVRFQRAFEASSRFINSIDEMLDTLINGTGRVGR